MKNQDSACPAGPDTLESGKAPPPITTFAELSRRFRDFYGLRTMSLPVANLSPTTWEVLQAIYHHLWGAIDAWPTQPTLAMLTGRSIRTVRDATRELEAAELLVTRRVPRSRRLGGFNLHYGPGPALITGLERLAERAKKKAMARAEADGAPPQDDGPEAAPRAKTLGRPCGKGSRVHAAGRAADHSPSGSQPTSSSHHAPAEPAATSVPARKEEVIVPPSEKEAERNAALRAVAADVLAALARAQRPDRPLHGVNREALDLVARRLAELPGSPHDARVAGLDAVAGAMPVSKGPPNVNFIFERQEHFLDHVDRGRGARVREERRAAAQEARERREAERAAVPPAASPKPREGGNVAGCNLGAALIGSAAIVAVLDGERDGTPASAVTAVCTLDDHRAAVLHELSMLGFDHRTRGPR